MSSYFRATAGRRAAGSRQDGVGGARPPTTSAAHAEVAERAWIFNGATRSSRALSLMQPECANGCSAAVGRRRRRCRVDRRGLLRLAAQPVNSGPRRRARPARLPLGATSHMPRPAQQRHQQQRCRALRCGRWLERARMSARSRRRDLCSRGSGRATPARLYSARFEQFRGPAVAHAEGAAQCTA